MKTFEELVEEVYRDADLRPEFVKYAELRARVRQPKKQPGAEAPPVPAGPYQFLSYDEISEIGAAVPPERAEEIGRLRWGITILSSTLFKTLSLRYPLEAGELHLLREAVLLRYEQTLGQP
jgi:hypothetical protein